MENEVSASTPSRTNFKLPHHRKKCVVKRCPNIQYHCKYKYFEFPLNQQRYQQWVDFCKNPKLLDGLTPAQVRAKYSICSRHFGDNQFIYGNEGEIWKLGATQIPSLNAPKEFIKPEDKIGGEDVREGGFIETNTNSMISHLLNNKSTLESITDAFAAMCRICLESVSSCKIRLTNSDEVKSLFCRKMIHLVLPELNLDIYLNPVICKKCESRLFDAYMLKKQLKKSEELLRQVLSTVEGGNDETRQIIKREIEEESVIPDQEIIFLDHDYAKRVKPDEVIGTEIDIKSSRLGSETEEINPLDSTDDSTNSDSTNIEVETLITLNLQELKTNSDKDQTTEKHKLPKNKKRYFLPNIHNLLDEESDAYFARPKIKKHTKLKQILRRISIPDKGEPPFLCEKCGRLFAIWKNYQNHISHHEFLKIANDNFTCKKCGLTLKNSQRVQHLASHKPKPFECGICGQRFTYFQFIGKHIKYKHPNGLLPDKYTQCHICGKKVTRIFFGRHLKIHSPTRNLECHICQKVVSVNVYSKHLNKHNQVLECSFCGKMAATKVSLQQHTERFHGKGGDFLCGSCGKRYVSRQSLRRHYVAKHLQGRGKKID